MADKPFDRQIINPRERPVSGDPNQQATYSDLALRALLSELYAVRDPTSASGASLGPQTGFIGDGYRVKPSSPTSMVVKVSAGLGFYDAAANTASDIDSAYNVDDLHRYKPMVLTADESITLAAADPTNPRIDIIEVAIDRRATDSASVDVLDTTTGVFGAVSRNKTLTWAHDGRQGTVAAASASTTGIGVKTGTPAGSPTAPTVTAGYRKIAEVRVAAATTTIAENAIRDVRPLLFPGNTGKLLVVGEAPGNGTAPTVTNIYGPPGVRATVQSSGVGNYILYLYVLVPDADTRVSARVMSTDLTLGGFSGGTLNVASGTTGTSDQTDFADAGLSNPVLAVALGQHYYLFTATFDDSTPTSGMPFMFEITISRAAL